VAALVPALMPCPDCGTLSPNGQRCAACQAGHVAASAHDVQCPQCTRPLAFNEDGLNCCGTCGGVFLSREELTRLEDAPSVHVSGGATRLPLTVSSVRYVRCPSCNEPMNRVNYGPKSGLIVDVCKLHGTWFDGGELERALLFLAEGGTRVRPPEPARRAPATSVASEVGRALTAPVKPWSQGTPEILDLLRILLG
jgi:Zn-finger nucleic acid-binding protein